MTAFDRERDRDRDRGYGDRFGGAGYGPPQEPVRFNCNEIVTFTLTCCMFRALTEVMDDHFMVASWVRVAIHMKCQSDL